jgi:hypothetical protein
VFDGSHHRDVLVKSHGPGDTAAGRLRDEVLAITSHDRRSPLSGIQLQGGLLRRLLRAGTAGSAADADVHQRVAAAPCRKTRSPERMGRTASSADTNAVAEAGVLGTTRSRGCGVALMAKEAEDEGKDMQGVLDVESMGYGPSRAVATPSGG